MPERAETIILLWADGYTAEQIADETGYSRDAVFFHLRRARELGDARAARRTQRAPYRRKKSKILILHRIGLETAEIAKTVGCSQRLVQMRVSEAG